MEDKKNDENNYSAIPPSSRRRMPSFIGVGLIVLLVIIIAAIIWPILAPPTNCFEPRIVCMSNLKQLGTAMLMYAADYNDNYPPSDKWNDLRSPYTKNPKLLICPKALDQSQPSYAMNSRFNGLTATKVRDPAIPIMLFDSISGENRAGGPGILVPRHDDGCDVVFGDGHVKWCSQSDIGSLEWDPTKPASVASP